MSQLDWNATLNTIRETLPQAQFQNWVKPLRLIRCDNHSVVVGVPNRFHQEWVKNNYSEALSEAIRHQTGSRLQLEFEIVLKEENHSASQSALPGSSSESESQPTRPSLRVVEGLGLTEGQALPVEAPAPTTPVIPEKPNLPVFNDTLIELDFNTVAVQCARMFSIGKGMPINPLVVYAGVGMGKTHLLSQIGWEFHRANPQRIVRYVTAESFTNEMVQSYKSNQIYAFKKKYSEHTDVLLFDDVQGLSKRLKTQEELLHIFNEIVVRGGKVCFATSTAPHALESFIDPLKSRILSGVIAEISPPSYETRVQLLQMRCAQEQIQMQPEILRSLAAQGQRDVREILGSLIRLHLQAQLENRPVDQEFLAKKNWSREVRKEAITMEEIITMVEHNFGVSREDLTSKSRRGVIVWARQVAMYLARQHTQLSLEGIGKVFGRDHATVCHAFQKVKDIAADHPTRRYEVEYLEKKISSRSPEE